MNNIEKLRELKDYQLIRVLDLLSTHVYETQERSGALDNLDAIDLHEDSESIQISWLNSEYSERVGFRFLTPNGLYFAKPEDIKPPYWFDPKDEEQIEIMVNNHNKHFEDSEEYEDDEDYDY